MSKYKVIKIPKEDWNKEFARNAHISVFDSEFDTELHPMDFAYLVADENEAMISYCTLREMNKDQVVMDFGGTFPDFRGSAKAFPSFIAMLERLKQSYKRAIFVTNNENYPMLKFGLKAGFKITGMSLSDKVGLLIEHTKEL